jgi:hypothetical protein
MTRYKPNVIRGGRATNIKGNLYYMSGRKHEAGGIDIGKNPKTGLEVEDGEIVQKYLVLNLFLMVIVLLNL